MKTNRLLSLLIASLTSINISSYVFSQENWRVVSISKPLNSIHFSTSQKGNIYGTEVQWTTSNGGTNWSYLMNSFNIGTFPDNSIFFIDSLNWWAANFSFNPLKTTNGGLSWQSVYTGQIVGLYSVFFTDAMIGYAWGIHNRNIIKTTNGGNSWYTIYTGFISDISSLYFTDNNNGFATFGYDWSFRDSIAVTVNGGASWEKKMLTPLYHSPTKVYFVDHEHGWILCNANYMLRTTDGGQNWQLLSVPMGYPNKILFLDPQTGFALNGSEIWKSTNGGLNWQVLMGNDEGWNWAGINFVDYNTGYVVGNEGVIYSTTDGGNNWGKDSTKFSNQNIISVSFITNVTGWACSINKIYNSTNGGNTWSTKYTASGFYVNKIFAVNQDIVIAVGTNGKILKTTNGGLNWNVEIISGNGNSLNSIYFINSNSGWVAGDAGLIRHSTNSGLTWQVQNSNTLKNLNSISATDQNNCYIVGDSGIILNTTNGGSSWNGRVLFNKRLRCISFINDTTGFMISNRFVISGILTLYENMIYKTSDRGQSWLQTYSSLGPLYLNSISFSGSLIGVAIGYGNGIIRTLNGGQTWSAYDINVGLVDFLDVCYKNNVGFIVGSNGCILTSTNNPIGINTHSNIIPENFHVFQNYPNPFNPVTKIKYSVSKIIFVNLTIYNITGEKVAVPVNETRSPGEYELTFNSNSNQLSSGIYFYVFRAGDFKESKKMIIVK